MSKVTAFLLTAATMVACATSAQAAPGTLTSVSNESYTRQRSAPAGSTFVDFENGLPNGFSLQGGQIVSGSVPGSYSAPSGDTTSYLAVQPNGTATLTADKAFGYGGVALNWGSIDSANILDILDLGGKVIATVTGSDVLDGRGFLDFSKNRYVTYSLDPKSGQQIGGLRFSSPNSSGWAFEADDIAFFNATPAPVPEPASIALFGAGLVGLAGMAKRRRRQAA